MKVFISYSQRDPDKRSSLLGKKLAKFLVARNIDVIFDELSFGHGKIIAQEMINGIYSSDKFIFLTSAAALKSKYVITELQFAKDRAIKLQPDSFIHVINLSDGDASICLPDDLKASLCHLACGKTENKLFYEVFLSLYDIRIGGLIKKLIKHNPDSKWMMLERYQKIDILNKQGDVRVTTLRSIMNITDTRIKHSSKMNIWAYGPTKARRMKVIATGEKGKELRTKVEWQSFRGEPTTECTIHFLDSIPPEEVFLYKTEYKWPRGFDLYAGDSYTLDCEDMAYGYLRLDFFFPRFTMPITPTVTIKRNKTSKPKRIDNLGSNKFSYSTINILPGTIYKFNLKLQDN